MMGAVRFSLAVLTVWIVLFLALGMMGPLVFALDTLAHFRLHLMLAAIAAGALALIFGARVAAWGAGFSALAAAVLLGPVWAELPEGPADGLSITVLAANVQHENGDPAALSRALLAADADILVTSETIRPLLEGAAPLDEVYPYRLVVPTASDVLRTAIFSRFPMREARLFLDNEVFPTVARAVVDLPDGTALGVIGIHLSRPLTGLQGTQLETLGAIAAPLPEHRIMLGDMNATPWSHAATRAGRLTGTEIVGGYRPTWDGGYVTPLLTVPEPLGHPIDHLYVSPGVGVRAIRTIALPGSDHEGVFAEIALPPAALPGEGRGAYLARGKTEGRR